MEKNKTAVEWLVEQLFADNEIFGCSKELLEQAKEMHKEEIIKSCNAGLSGIPRSAKQYYEQEYGKQ